MQQLYNDCVRWLIAIHPSRILASNTNITTVTCTMYTAWTITEQKHWQVL